MIVLAIWLGFILVVAGAISGAATYIPFKREYEVLENLKERYGKEFEVKMFKSESLFSKNHIIRLGIDDRLLEVVVIEEEVVSEEYLEDGRMEQRSFQYS